MKAGTRIWLGRSTSRTSSTLDCFAQYTMAPFELLDQTCTLNRCSFLKKKKKSFYKCDAQPLIVGKVRGGRKKRVLLKEVEGFLLSTCLLYSKAKGEKHTFLTIKENEGMVTDNYVELNLGSICKTKACGFSMFKSILL